MKKTGILLHVYHLETIGWDELVWGYPERNELGTGTKLAECLLDIPADEAVAAVIYSGPSQRDGLTEGAYTKKFILDHLEYLAEFPRLQQKLDALTPEARDVFVRRMRDIVVGPVIKNTAAELEQGAKFFTTEQVDRVIQIAAATHAPRCLRDQAVARAAGLIPLAQQWFVAASDVSYHSASPSDVVIAEPMHRQDNPLYGFHPSWVEVTKRYPQLSLENKKALLYKMDEITSEMLVAQPHDTEVAN